MPVILTTAPAVAGREIVRELGVVSADCVYGMNIFRDVFAAARDLVGGRSRASEKVLADARRNVLQTLEERAAELGADAIVAIEFDVNELVGKMLAVTAVGTAVKLGR